MNQKNKLKGFTLIELIVVIAIIGILAGILAPAMATYYWKSRVKAANADAKMVYNAAQTEVQKYLTIDRNTTSGSGFGSYIFLRWSPATNTVSYSNLDDGMSIQTVTHETADTNMGEAMLDVVERVNQLVSGAEDVEWAISVRNYVVTAAVSAESLSTKNVGQYSAVPISVEQQEDAYSATYRTVLDRLDADYAAATPAVPTEAPEAPETP